jgi:hypothetical protein
VMARASFRVMMAPSDADRATGGSSKGAFAAISAGACIWAQTGRVARHETSDSRRRDVNFTM